MSAAGAAVRVCRTHGSTCVERGDVVICPSGGGHSLFEGQWTTAARRSSLVPAPRFEMSAANLEGADLVAQRAREAWLRAHRETRTAIAELVSEARANPRIMAALLEPYIETAAAEAIHQAASGRPMPVTTLSPAVPKPAPALRAAGGNPDRALSDGGLELLAGSNVRNLLSFVLPDGQVLGSATGRVVGDAAIKLGVRVAAAAVHARWLSLIARRMGAAGVVGDVFTEASLHVLLSRAANDVARVIAVAPRARLNASPPAAPRPQDN
jgi:hypothetical protein